MDTFFGSVPIRRETSERAFHGTLGGTEYQGAVGSSVSNGYCTGATQFDRPLVGGLE
jgi:hypothetical protein